MTIEKHINIKNPKEMQRIIIEKYNKNKEYNSILYANRDKDLDIKIVVTENGVPYYQFLNNDSNAFYRLDGRPLQNPEQIQIAKALQRGNIKNQELIKKIANAAWNTNFLDKTFHLRDEEQGKSRIAGAATDFFMKTYFHEATNQDLVNYHKFVDTFPVPKLPN